MSTVTSPTSPTSNLPTRTTTLSSGAGDDDVIPVEDTSEVTKLFLERLQAWKHACGYFEDYIKATEKVHEGLTKDYEKVLKSVSSPLKEGHHFAQELGGVAGLFDNIRSNTQGISHSHQETAKNLKGSVLPIFERLHTEIKNKTKELNKGAGKGSKAVDKARAATQKQIEKLGTHTATFDSTGGKVNAIDDPYVLKRHVNHLLHKQLLEENNNRNDMIAVQNSFFQFESHVISTFQTGVSQFNQVVNGQVEQQKAIYSDITATAQRIAPDFEWNGFVERNSTVLIDPQAPPRTVANVGYANQDHRGTQPMIAGSLERKAGVLKKWEPFYYVITPSKFLHEFKTDDDFSKEPSPENSLYLPDCLVGAVAGQNFNVKGKDVSGSSIGNKFSVSKEFKFKAHTPTDAQQWWEVIKAAAGTVSTATDLGGDDDSTPTSPADTKAAVAPVQTQALPQEQGVVSPAPASATTDTPAAAPAAAAPVAAAPVAAEPAAAPVSGVQGEPGKY